MKPKERIADHRHLGSGDGGYLDTASVVGYGTSQTVPATSSGVDTLAELLDVDLLTTPPANNDSLTYDSASGKWVPDAVAGGTATDLGWFVVTDYGALGDGSTDDTSAIQDTIDAAYGAGGAVVYFPVGVYVVGGALQDTGAFNAQLLLPDVDYTEQQVSLTFLGALRPEAAGTVQAGTPKSGDGYSIIKSTLTGASGTAALLSGGQFASLAATNNLRVTFKDLVFEVPPNPTFTVLNLNDCQNPTVDGVFIYTGETTSVTQPTHSNAYGVKMGHNGTSNWQIAWDVLVSGMYTAVMDGDRVFGRGLRVGNCVRALELPFKDQTSDWELFQAGCTIGMIATGATNNYVRIDYRAEHLASPSWQITTADLSDASNYLFGDLVWSTTESGVGNSHTFTQSGGTNLQVRELGSAPSGAPSTADYLVGTANGSLSAEIVVGTSPGGELGGTWASPTVDATHSGSTHAATQAAAEATAAAALAAHIASSGSGSTDHVHIVDEVFSGDASTTVFPLANEAIPETVMAYVSGTRTPVTLGGTLNDEITFGSAPASASNNISVDYAAVAS